MLNFQKIRLRSRVFQQLTGLTVAVFETLLADFERADDDDRQQRDQQRPTPRQRHPGGGATCQWIHRLPPIVNQALGSALHLPARQPAQLRETNRVLPKSWLIRAEFSGVG